MSSTYSPDLRIELIAEGDQAGTWGTTTNNNFQYVFESAIAGFQQVPIAPTSNNQVLTYVNGASSVPSLNQSVYAILELVPSSVSANFNVFAPPNSKAYLIYNTSGYAATFYNSTIIGNTTPAGGGITIPNNSKMSIWTDGTNFYGADDTAGGNFSVVGNLAIGGNLTVTGTTTFTGIPSGPTASPGTNTTQLATTAFVTQNAVLTGALMMWPTASAPSGYLLCNGSAVSRTTYAALFAVVGTTFGAGDGSTTFNLPNYADRMPIGAGTIAASIGATGGSASTTLSVANLPSHTHSFSGSGSGTTNGATTGIYDAGHTHPPLVNGTTFVANGGGTGGTGPNSNASLGSTTGTGFANIQDPGHAHSFGVSISGTTGTTGSGTAATTISPYLGINFIIKT